MPTQIIQCSLDDLRRLVAEAAPRRQLPALLDLLSLAEQLSVSERTARELVEEGMPYVWVGKRKRFELDDVRAWLKSRPADSR
jgi:excisionase family DNA binding protein